MYFDKTKNLNGCNVKAVLIDEINTPQYDVMHSGCDRCRRSHHKIACNILNHINATITVKLTHNFGGFNDHSEPYGAVKEAISSTVDVVLNPYFLRYQLKSRAYPVFSNAFKILSSKRKIAYNERFLAIFRLEICGFLLISWIISIGILKHLIKKSIAETAFEFLHIFVNPAGLETPRISSARILLIIFMYTIFSFTSFVQSCFSAVNTAPHKARTIDSVQDLINSNLTLCGLPNHKDLIWHKKIREHYRSINNIIECTDILLKSGTVACMYFEPSLRYFFSESKSSHISEHNLLERFNGYIMAADSPLTSKFNQIQLQFFEGGIISLFRNREEQYYSKPNAEGNRVKSLDIENIAFNFYMLLGGWLLSTFVLFLEIIV